METECKECRIDYGSASALATHLANGHAPPRPTECMHGEPIPGECAACDAITLANPDHVSPEQFTRAKERQAAASPQPLRDIVTVSFCSGCRRQGLAYVIRRGPAFAAICRACTHAAFEAWAELDAQGPQVPSEDR